MDLRIEGNLYFAAFKKTPSRITGGVTAVVVPLCVAETKTHMQRPSVYSYRQDEPPGCNVHRLREALGWSIRKLADECTPPLDKSTVARVEQNLGFTQDTLERIAKAIGKGLGVQLRYTDLFLPMELADFPTLPENVRRRIAESVQDAAAAVQYKARKPTKNS